MKKVMISVACGLSLLLVVASVLLPGRSRHRGTASGPIDPAMPGTPPARKAAATDASPDPAAPPEWDLFNKDSDKGAGDPTRAYWSLEVMAFKANPLRKGGGK